MPHPAARPHFASCLLPILIAGAAHATPTLDPFRLDLVPDASPSANGSAGPSRDRNPFATASDRRLGEHELEAGAVFVAPAAVIAHAIFPTAAVRTAPPTGSGDTTRPDGPRAPTSVAEAEAETALAKQVQNPVADLISLPFQWNVNFGYGADDDVQTILNIQPVVPFHLTDDLNLITRAIVPVIHQPGQTSDDAFGLGDTSITAFLSPAGTGALTWGVGPVFVLPTATDRTLGGDQWGAGVSAVAVASEGPWVFGALVSNAWSIAGPSSRQNLNLFTLQPFVNYNLADGWYIGSAPLVTANWSAPDSERWTVPVGAGVGKVFRVGGQPMNLRVDGYWNAERSTDAAEWQLRIQLTFLFPG